MLIEDSASPRHVGSPADIDGEALERRLARRLLPPLFMVSLLCQLDRSNLAFAALQMDAQLGFSKTIHGLGSGLFFVGYLAQVPANMVCLAVGPRRWLPGLLVAWGCIAACFAGVRGVRSFLALRLLLGVAEAGAYPAIFVWLGAFFTPRQLGPAFTWVTTATAVAGLLGAPLAACLMSLDGALGLEGWRWLFLVEGFAPVLLAAALPFLLPATPLTAAFLAPAEQQWLWRQLQGEPGVELVGPPTAAAPAAATTTAAAAAALVEAAGAETAAADAGAAAEAAARRPLLPPDRDDSAAALPGGAATTATAGKAAPHKARPFGGGGALRAAIRGGLLDRRVYHLAAVMMLIDVVMNAANFFLPMIVRAVITGQFANEGGSGGGGRGGGGAAALNIRAALLSALPFCAAAVAMVANAHHARARDERRLHTALPMVATALALAGTPALVALGPAPALLGLSAAAAGIWAVHGPFFSWPAALLDRQPAALAFALIKSGGAVGGFAGPLAVGAMADVLGGWGGAMLLLAGCALACAGLVLVFDDRPRR
ncbi:MFS transporter isoform A [Micractinium conductrix]|uniref:MFS transporter isoform A n=1 Tax=Micractinium conductrix TaxID=554055 RepID=A0A2P6VIV5_9CHLO|nr:MFS transporter isoform A [Micractinium conductrix]|eukprot:PSC74031.1 MFS transporter isoform A [Micractinium conductrix]